MTARISACAALLALFCTGCDTTAPGADGDVEVSLQAPSEVDGAALLELAGTVRGVTMFEPGKLLTHTSNDTTWVFVALETPGKIRFLVELPPGGSVPSTSILQVADGENRLRANLDGYSVRLR